MLQGNYGAPDRRREIRRAKVIVVMSAYNEEKNVGGLLDRIDDALAEERLPYEVIIVDDGSSDGTVSVAESYREQLPLTIYRHEINKGLGATIRDGLYIASKRAADNDTVITMDADETHTPGLIIRMIRMIREGHDVVIASRYQPARGSISEEPRSRALLSSAKPDNGNAPEHHNAENKEPDLVLHPR